MSWEGGGLNLGLVEGSQPQPKCICVIVARVGLGIGSGGCLTQELIPVREHVTT